MRYPLNSTTKMSLSLTEARRTLGTTATGLSDSDIKRIISQVDSLTDMFIAYMHDSKIQSSIDILGSEIHNDG